MGLLTTFRMVCYVVLLLFSAVTVGLTAARLHYTLHLPLRDPLNGGVDFYDPIIAEILATACLSILLVPVLIMRIHKRHEHGFLSTFLGELIGLLLLFFLWIVGAAVATQKWGNLNWCHTYAACRLLTVIVAFTWMSWIMTTLLNIACIGYILKYRSSDPLYGPDRHYEREKAQA